MEPVARRRRCCGWLRALIRALGPEPDQAVPAPPSRCDPDPFVFSNEESLSTWARKRSRWAYFTVGMHWTATILLNAFFHFDVARKFREEVDGALEFLYFSALVSMIFFALVALADPGYLPVNIHGPVSSTNVDEVVVAAAATCWVGDDDKKMMKAVTGAGDLIEEGDDEKAAEEGGDSALVVAGRDGEGGKEGVGDEEDVAEPLLNVTDPEVSKAVRDWVKKRHCNVCRINVPIRAKHCKACGRCVSRMDHHCVWIGNCVGAKNHLPFLFYLLFQCIHLSYGLFILTAVFLPAFLTHYNFSRGFLGLLGGLALNISLTAPEALLKHPLRSIFFITVCMMWIFTNGVLLGQLKVISSNLLTTEALGGRIKYPYLAGDRNPFDRGCFWNCITFCRRDRRKMPTEKALKSNTTDTSNQVTRPALAAAIPSIALKGGSSNGGGSSSPTLNNNVIKNSSSKVTKTRFAAWLASLRTSPPPPSLLPHFHRARSSSVAGSSSSSSSASSSPSSSSYYSYFIRLFKVAE